MDQPPLKYCGREFSAKEMEWIRQLIGSPEGFNRAQLSRKVCAELGWFKPDGGLKEMSCRVAMLRMEKDGLLTLPKPMNVPRNRSRQPKITGASDPRGRICVLNSPWPPIVLQRVKTPTESSLWNELIERYHYLRYHPLPGAQMRYMVYGGSEVLAVLGFGAAAWKVAPRDRYIGWTAQQRQARLHLIVNNARFLILPWITWPNLASRILSIGARQLPGDWKERYNYAPVFMETFVEQGRFKGTCYKAANWIHVGQTQGRGKLDRMHCNAAPVKEIFLYPLRKHPRKELCAPLP
jgi:hypothetical protein